MLGLVFLNDCGHVSDCLGPPGGAQAGHRVAGEEIMQELRETTSLLVNNVIGGGVSQQGTSWWTSAARAVVRHVL